MVPYQQYLGQLLARKERTRKLRDWYRKWEVPSEGSEDKIESAPPLVHQCISSWHCSSTYMLMAPFFLNLFNAVFNMSWYYHPIFFLFFLVWSWAHVQTLGAINLGEFPNIQRFIKLKKRKRYLKVFYLHLYQKDWNLFCFYSLFLK